MTQNSIKNVSMSKIIDFKSSLDENNSSAWMAKKQRSKVEKDLVILQNRINLLTLEDRKAKNKFQKTKKQTEKVLQLKKNIDEMRTYKQQKQAELDNELMANQRSSQEKRYKQQVMLSNLRNALLQMKKEEYNKIKEISQKNKEELDKFKKAQSLLKKSQITQVKSIISHGRQKIENFWIQKLHCYTEQHRLESLENEKLGREKEKELEILEKQELALIDSLNKTQINQEKLEEKLESVFMMSAGDLREKLEGREVA